MCMVGVGTRKWIFWRNGVFNLSVYTFFMSNEKLSMQLHIDHYLKIRGNASRKE